MAANREAESGGVVATSNLSGLFMVLERGSEGDGTAQKTVSGKAADHSSEIAQLWLQCAVPMVRCGTLCD